MDFTTLQVQLAGIVIGVGPNIAGSLSLVFAPGVTTEQKIAAYQAANSASILVSYEFKTYDQLYADLKSLSSTDLQTLKDAAIFDLIIEKLQRHPWFGLFNNVNIVGNK